MGKSNTTPPTADKSKDKGGDKKPRAARKNYGYAKGATIQLTDGEQKFRGARARWYEYLKKSNGKSVEHFDGLAKKAEEKEASRGWVRFFVEVEACTLKAPAEA